jgi:hypothetical protein
MNRGAQDPGGKGGVLKLHHALGISSGDVAAFVGAGGKSSAILMVAGELSEVGMTVLAAPTTKMLVNEAERIGPLVTSEDEGELRARAEEALSGGARGVVVGGGLLSKNRVGGVEPGAVSSLVSLADVVLVEADGSRRRPIKGTAAYEPALPEATTLVVAVANIGAFGSQSITAGAFARALAEGSLASVPERARTAALITGVSPGKSMADAAVVTRELWRLGVKKVVLSSLPDESPGQVWIP